MLILPGVIMSKQDCFEVCVRSSRLDVQRTCNKRWSTGFSRLKPVLQRDSGITPGHLVPLYGLLLLFVPSLGNWRPLHVAANAAPLRSRLSLFDEGPEAAGRRPGGEVYLHYGGDGSP